MNTPTLLSELPLLGASLNPRGISFTMAGESITHEQFAHGACGLAHALVDAGAQPGAKVGLLLNKSLHMPVALYGVLGAGCVYVPLDTRQPLERVLHILRDADIRYLIAGDDQAKLLQAILTADAGIECVWVDQLVLPDDTLADDPLSGNTRLIKDSFNRQARSMPVQVDEQAPAYMLYTSGTTGVPKGIVHTHASGMAYARLAASTYALRASDVMGNFSPLHFDMSAFEFFGGPLVGAKVVLVPPSFGFAVASLAELMEKEQLTVWYSVPYVLIKLESSGVLADRDLSHLRWVNFAGEAYPVQQLHKLMQRLPHARFSNIYGPTETNQCTYYHVTEPLRLDVPLPIGQAWDETHVLVVDDDDRQVVPGNEGELLVHSTTTMQGYWARPDLNAGAFFDDPEQPGRRYYRTGDVVKQDAQGNLHIVGRKDRQVKVNGYRVELDEIEHVLGAHPAVVEAAVFAVTEDEQVRIEAAVILSTSAAEQVTDKDLRKHIGERLPAYAIPRRVALLDSLPRTATDKLDRRALAAQLGFTTLS